MEITFELVLVCVVLTGLILTLIKGWVAPAIAFVCAMAVFVFTGLITPKEMLVHLANETVVTLILLLQVTSVVERTPFIPWLSFRIFDRKSEVKSQAKLAGLTILLSSVLNNTAIVASFMGAVKGNRYFSPSKFLIPLSYAAIIGGCLTLIGTSTNLVVNSFVVNAGFKPIGFFDFIYVGLPIALLAIVILVFVTPRLLPDYGSNKSQSASQYFVEARVKKGSRLIGRSVQDNGFRNLSSLFLAEIIRENRLISPVNPDEMIQEGDALVFTGDVRQIQELNQFDGLTLVLDLDPKLMSNLKEVVVANNSTLIGQTIKNAQFRTRFDAAVVGVRRGDEKLSGKIGNIELQAGDNLILAAGKEFNRHMNLRRNFYMVGSISTSDYLSWKEGWLIISLFVAGIILAATEVVSLFKVVLALLLIFMGLRFLRIRDMRNNSNFDLLIMIGCSIGMAQIMSKYGIDTLISNSILGIFGTESPRLALAGVYIATALITEIVTNNAAAALLFPVALATAQTMGVSPVPFFMALAYGASASFLTPIGYQTNTMVYSLGRYKFTDYFIPGLIFNVLFAVLCIWLVPYFFPF